MFSLAFLLIAVLLVFVQTFSEAKPERLQGRLARCADHGSVLRLPILAGNPCISCRCQQEQVICTRYKCPTMKCNGKLERIPGKCCPICAESSLCVTHHHSYQNGEKWYDTDCRVCQCTNKTITCEKQQCKPNVKCAKGLKPGLKPGSCCLECVEETGVCTSYGDPHFQTFDGKMYNFRGNCRYKLAADCQHDNFTIRMRNEQRKRSRAKYLAISIGLMHVSLQPGLVVRVDRREVKLPFYKLPHLQITKKNFVVTVLTGIGVQILWDGDSFIEVHVPNRYKGRTCGLCGNFNTDSSDDFKIKNGQITSSVHKFASSWAIGRHRNNCKRAPAPPKQSTVCKIAHHWRARKRCWPLKRHFSNCHKAVNPQRYYKDCISDVCTCRSKRCECESLLAYARACTRMGVTVKWSRRKVCGMSCKGGSVFDDCVPSCKRTCLNKDDPSFACPHQHCVPGCRCPAGQVWDERSRNCVFPSTCPDPVSTHKT